MTTTNNNMIIATTLIASIGFVSTTSTAQYTFDAAVMYGAALSPNGMTSADFNGDGNIDLATTTSGALPDGVAVFLNAGDGTYGAPINTILPASSNPRDLIAGDLDGDGDIDLAVALRDDPAGSIRILHNIGGGSFTLGQSATAGDRPAGLSIADMDGDGDLDIAAANRNSDSVTVITNDGTGVFTSAQFLLSQGPRSTTFGDFIPGGSLEIAVTNHSNRSIAILASKGGVLVEVMTLFVASPVRPDGIDSGDLNGDGLIDLAVVTMNFDASNPANNVDDATVFLNTGFGFSPPVSYATGGLSSEFISVADHNCDGSLDMVVSNKLSNNVSVFPNNGDGTYGAASLVSTGSGPSKATANDFNGDGNLDLAVSNTLAGEVSVMFNHTCAAPCLGDVSGDGAVDVVDLLSVIAVWGPCTGCVEDINGDSFVDVVDLLEIIGTWGVCP